LTTTQPVDYTAALLQWYFDNSIMRRLQEIKFRKIFFPFCEVSNTPGIYDGLIPLLIIVNYCIEASETLKGMDIKINVRTMSSCLLI
jgi:hypothetical protein